MKPEKTFHEMKRGDAWAGRFDTSQVLTESATSRRPYLATLFTVAAAAVVVVVLASALVMGVRGGRTVPALPVASGTPTPVTSPTDASPAQSPSSEPSASITPYAGSATCVNLLDAAKRASLQSQGFYENEPISSDKVLANPDDTNFPFAQNGDLMCSWGPKGGESALLFSYGPITAESAERERSVLKSKGFKSVRTKNYEEWKRPDTTGLAYAFGDGYWAYAYDNGGGFVLDQIVANSPKF